MPDRIDHAALSRSRIENALSHYSTGEDAGAVVVALAALNDATLALVEQQRIANLVALSQAQDGNGWQAAEPLESLFAYRDPDPEDGFEGLHIRPEVAAALGIEREARDE